MKSLLFIDIETFSEHDITKTGHFKYANSPFFDILLVCYAIDYEEVKTVDLVNLKEFPKELKEKLESEDYIKVAHNASFERVCLEKFGIELKGTVKCTQVLAAYCGFPQSLKDVSNILLENAKLETGTALIKHFCSFPIAPYKGEKWEQFKEYCKRDVEATQGIYRIFKCYPFTELDNYNIDQSINNRGILIDLKLVKNAIELDNQLTTRIKKELQAITGLYNPNSNNQFKEYLNNFLEVSNVQKETLEELLKDTDLPGHIRKAINLKLQLSKSSIKKYTAMLNCADFDNRARGLFQFYGASKTGRWAGRLIQLHNLPRNYSKDLDRARNFLREGKFEDFINISDSPKNLLSELIRTSFISSTGLLGIADFSSIEARIIAWLANEKWRLEVFSSHGKIYEASASKMFNVPIEQIKKGSELRYKGKVSELALGYQGANGALIKMGALKMGIEESELATIVKRWRTANPAIVNLWQELENAVIKAVKYKGKEIDYKGLKFIVYRGVLHIRLPSGRFLLYVRPHFGTNQFGQNCVNYWAQNQTSKKWEITNFYGGKITENIVQGIARDCLMIALYRAEKAGFRTVLHVHDEIGAEIEEEKELKKLIDLMEKPISWLDGFRLKAEGFISEYYKKD